MRTETWSVLATGPSLRRVRPEDLAEGPVVALNLAVLSPLPRDFWCCLDGHLKFEQVWGPLKFEQRRRELPLLMCTETAAPHWQALGIRCWPFPATEAGFRHQNLRASRANTFPVFHITILAAISRCVGLGAKRVDVWGCDLAGHEHAYGTDPDKHRTKEVWHGRWAGEQEILATAIKEWEQCGTEVHLRAPK